MKPIFILLTAAVLCAAESFAAPLGTSFTYQGRLNDGGAPATGVYDLTFTLHDDPNNIASVGTYIILTAVPITNGLFTVELNSAGEFGANAFNGEARWLQIGVRTNNNNALNNFIFLAPRQQLTAAPHALFAANATQAGTANSATVANSVAWANITGIPADFADGVDNGTQYTAGAGLMLSGGNEFSVNFAGSGVADTAARSDHGHFGAGWGGSTALASGISVTNSANNSVGLYGQQGTGSGFPYIFYNTAGVWGESSHGNGVWGASATNSGVLGITLGTNGYGVRGAALRTNGTSYGVYGSSASAAGVGVFGLGGKTATNPIKDYVGTFSFGVVGESADSTGVIGISDSSVGTFGASIDGSGVTGTSAHYVGVVGQGNSSSAIGVLAVNNSGVAFKAAGTGIIQSEADSVLWFPAAGLTRNYADTGFQIFPNNVYVQVTANETRTVSVELPLNLPSVLYGQPVTVKTLEVFYKCSNGGRSPVTSAVIQKIETDGTFSTVDSLSGFATSNTPAAITLTPNLTLSATSGFLLLHLAAAINNTADSVYYYGARVVLGHH
jgi:hypothetical protein